MTLPADAIALAELQAGLAALNKDGGPKAEASLHILSNRLYAFFRPNGYGVNEPSIIGEGNTPEACIAAARAQWEEMRDRVRADTVKKLSLAIIRITHEMGCCTDAALRAEFNPADVERYSKESVSLANSMAENGPFEIVELAGANAA